MKEKTFNKWFNIFIMVGMSICVVLSCINKCMVPQARVALLIVSAFGALMGVASTILSANGSIWTFVFGLVDVSIYSYILWDSHLPSQFLLHVLYFIPMEFIGFYKWRKRGASGHSSVKAQRLKGDKVRLYLALFVGVFIVAFGVDYLGISKADAVVNYSKVALDAVVTTSNIMALALMASAYMEQWYLWTLVNVFSVVLWSITLINDTEASYAVIPLVKYIFYTINGVNGIRIWWNLSKTADLEKSEKNA